MREVPCGDRDIDAVLGALAELDAREDRIKKQRIAEIRELAITLKRKDVGIADLPRIISTVDRVNGAPELRALEHVILYREFLGDRLSEDEKRKALFPSPLDTQPDGSGEKKLMYVPGEYSSRALKHFSGNVRGLIAESAQSYGAICEDIYSEGCDYGILPIRSSAGGRLSGFYSLIDRYELRIASACRIQGEDGGSTTFALVGKSLVYPDRAFGEPSRLEFFVSLDSDRSLREILSAAAYCGLELLGIDTFEFSSLNDRLTFCPIFSLDGADTETFLLYMAADFPQYIPIGIYKTLE